MKRKNLPCKLYIVETNYHPEVQGCPDPSSTKVPRGAKQNMNIAQLGLHYYF